MAPSTKDTRSGVRRTALTLALLALAVYAGFILMAVHRAS
jgi:hypothetical protein